MRNFFIEVKLVSVLAVFDNNNVLDRRSTAWFTALYAIITTFAGIGKDN